jgi:VWFA-related protein
MVYSVRYDSIWSGDGQFGAQTNWLERGKADLQAIAHATGGLAFDFKKDEPAAIFDRIEGDLRSQYVLGYTPSKATGKRGFRKIKVKVTRPGLTVRAQERYYMQ